MQPERAVTEWFNHARKSSLFEKLHTAGGAAHQTKHPEVILCKLGTNARLSCKRRKIALYIIKLND